MRNKRKKSFGKAVPKPMVPPCHVGPTEVVKNLFCGSEAEFLRMAKTQNNLDTLIPLCALDGEIWDSGFRGEILYFPIKDYGILPDDVLDSLVAGIFDRLKQNKKIGLFCMGGHGRTGYVASIILGKMGCDDPIGFLRKYYCEKAVESNAQVYYIAKVIGKPELVQKYEVFESRYSCFDALDWYELDLLGL